MVSSKFFALSSLLVMAALPVRSAQIQVTVGGPGGVTQFSPSSVNANPGDVVSFVFQQKNHTATQSSFANPCSAAPGGFDSGFVPVSANNTAGPFQEAQFQVTDTNPVWVYCRQTGHCQLGMVFAINPGTQLAAFQAAAMATSNSSSTTTPSASSAAPSASSTSSSSTSQDHRVIVGGTTLTFEPSNVTAQPGDTITFEFHQKNHTATQSSFADPCQMLSSTSTSGQVGFDSGFMPVSANATTFPTYTVQVNDSSPIWAYCRQVEHCGEGMVFAANANESSANTFEAFEAKAKQTNGTGSSSNSTSSSGTGKSGAGAVRLGGTGIAIGLAALLLGLTL